MNISGPNANRLFEANVDPASGTRGRVMAARPATDAEPPQVITDGPGFQEESGPADIGALVTQANAMMRAVNVGIEFIFDPDARSTIIQVVDAETRDILRQFPSEDMLVLSRAIRKMQSTLVDQSV